MEASASEVETVCGNCQTRITGQAKFCTDCGQSLYESCQCGNQVLLSQTFCSACGANLRERLQERIEALGGSIDQAQQHAARGEFEAAIRMLDRIDVKRDYRFEHLVRRMQQLRTEWTQAHQEYRDRVRDLEVEARSLWEARRYRALIDALQGIPTGAYSQELRDMRSRAEEMLARESRLKTELQQALRGGKLEMALAAAEELLQIKPTSTSRQTQLKALVDTARKRIAQLWKQHDYRACVALVQRLPESARTPSIDKLERQAVDMLALESVVHQATYVHPALAQVAQQIAARRPADDQRQAESAEFKQRLRQHAPASPLLYPARTRTDASAELPHCVPIRLPTSWFARPDTLANGALPTLAVTAYALAVQAIRDAVPGENLQARPVRRRSLLPKRKRSRTARIGWGIDIGHRLIKAVCVEDRDGERPVILQALVIPVVGAEAPGTDADGKDQAGIERSLRRLREQADLEHGPVWVNFRSIDSFARPVLLPTNVDAQRTEEFLRQEVLANVPTSGTDIEWGYWVSDTPISASSRQAMVFAANASRVYAMRQMLDHIGLPCTGLLPDTLALWIAHQFLREDVYRHVAPATSASGQPQAVDLWLDIGYSATRVLMVGAGCIGGRTIAWGMQGLAAALSRSLQLTAAQASEAIAQFPAARLRSAEVLACLQSEAARLRSQIDLTRRAHAQTFGQAPIARTLIVGGGASQPLLADMLRGCEF